MISKVIFSVLVALLVAQLALADVGLPILCPNTETAKKLVFNEEVHEEAPKFGRTSKSLAVPTHGKVPTCILISKNADGGNVAMASIGISQDGQATVNLVSDIQQGIDAEVEVYTE